MELERDTGLAWLFTIRGPLPKPPEVAVIGLNSNSGKRLALAALPRDWPRSVHGRVLDELATQDAAAVVFDYDFSRPKDPKDDKEFAESVAAFGRVVMLQKLIGKREPVYGANGEVISWLWSEEAMVPAGPLGEATRGLGHFPLPKTDQAVHEFWTFKSSTGDAPTTSAISVQILALPYYREWLDVLSQAGVARVGELPARAEDIRSHEEMRTLMRTLRNTFTGDRGLKGRVDEILDATTGQAMPEQARSLFRALAALYAGPERRFLNFYGPPGTILTYPYEAMLPSSYSGKRPPKDGSLAGRVVFAGYSDLTHADQPDRYYTVFTNKDGVDLSGVEIMATALANLLNDTAILKAGPEITLASIIVFGFVIGVLVYALPALIAVPLTFLLTGLYAAAAQWLFNESALWLPLTTPLMVQMPFALLVGLITQYVLERRKVQSIAEALEMYVPESVVRDLTGEGVNPDSVNQVVYGTCLANDMSGFSTISEGKSPKELARFMNAYFDAMAQPLKRNGVDVTEFHADTIMCAWTKNQELPEARRQVIVGAIGVLDAMEEFNKVEQVSLSARIGLQDGNFYLGHTGGGGRMAYSILGDPANTASRLEGLNKFTRTQILAAKTVVDGVEGVLTRPVGSFQLVGKAEGLPACEILATMDNATAEQQELCESFPAALEAFQDQRWDDAKTQFEAILKNHPDDGPTAMYLELLAQYGEHGLPDGDPTIIRLTSK
jgi:adenylate cyclase